MAAAYKREVLGRLQRMRAEGLTVARIVALSEGKLSEYMILDVLAAKRVPIEVYRTLAAVLDKAANT